MTQREPTSTPPIAIIGVSALFPGSTNADGFWRDILSGRDLIGDVPKEHWLIEDYYDPDPKVPDKTYAKRGAFLDPIDFDALGWGIPPSIVPATDTAQLLALIVADRVLKEASRAHAIDKTRTSVILGVTSAQELLGAMVSRLQAPVWRKSLRDMGLPESQVKEACARISSHYAPWQEATFPGLLGNVVAGRIANRLDLGGTNCVTDAACASTFSALSMAVNELALGQSDLAIAGGVDTMNDIFMFMCFSKTPALSASGDCRPFSEAADGTMLGEGLAMFALARLDDALARGDRIYAVIKGIGAGSDGRAKSVYAPLAEGQARTLRRAYEAAGYGPESVELVEAHGTGTRAGDAAEFSGLAQVFQESAQGEASWCALGSVKSQIGHTKAAAGAAGLFKVVMALNEGILPPSIKIDRPNPKIDLETSPFHLATRTLPWVRGSDHRRRGSVSSFGFGGSNFHIALEAWSHPAPRRNTLPVEVVSVDAVDPAQLREALMELKSEVRPGRLSFLARQSHRGFEGRPSRAIFLVEDDAALTKNLDTALAHLDKAPTEALSTPDGLLIGHGPMNGKLAFLFPGQGSQYLDMSAGIAVRFAKAREAWDQAADLKLGDLPLHKVVFPPTAFDDAPKAAQRERLTQTEWAQPALGAASWSILSVLESAGVAPDMLGGHSFGELSALAAGGALSYADLLRLARRRGELMAEASAQPGAMLAVLTSIEKVKSTLSEAKLTVEIANHNAPEQVVVAGSVAAIEQADKIFSAAGFRTKRLSVSTAFHSTIVAGAKAPFGETLSTVAFSPPRLPVYANTSARPHAPEPDAIRSALSEQLVSSVRFVEMVEAMYQDGARYFLEVGPGHVLTGLVGRILHGRDARAIALDNKAKGGFLVLVRALAELAAAGAKVRFDHLFAEYETPVDPDTLAKPKLPIGISGANYGKPYPPAEGASALPPPNPERAPEAPLAAPSGTQAPVRKTPTLAASVPKASSAAASVRGAPAERPAAPQLEARAPTTQPQAMARVAPRPASLSSLSKPVASPTGLPVVRAMNRRKSPPPSSIPASRAPGRDWLTAWQNAQSATAEAQMNFQQTMAESHAAYLRVAETSLEVLARLADGTPAPTVYSNGDSLAANGNGAHKNGNGSFGTANGFHLPPPAQEVALHQPLALSAPAPQVLPASRPEPAAAPEVKPAPLEAKPAPHAPEVEVKTRPEPAVSTPAAAEPPAAAPAAESAHDLESTLRSVVADATGYPPEVLQSEMNLEADLGIDSIKRVEILSLVKKAVPELPELDAATLGSLETLGDVAGHLRSALGAPTPSGSPQPTAASPAPASTADLDAKLKAVVADATGYPQDVLQADMSLEADLGIDSIKRVEILSLVKKAVPELPELDAATLGSLETLGDVADHLKSALGQDTVVPAAPAPSSAPAEASTIDSAELEAKLKAVVADATGYPQEVLQAEMSLEADLGIDSIKRVEILSMVKKVVPALPELDAATLGSLETLGDVANHLQEALGGAPAESSAAPTQTATAPAVEPSHHRYLAELHPAPAAGLARLRPERLRSVAVVGGPDNIRAEVARALGAAGFPARAAAQVSESDDGVILLHGLDPVTSPADAVNTLRAAFSAVRAAKGVLLGDGGLLVSVQDTGGGFGFQAPPALARAPLVGLSALVKTARLEAPSSLGFAMDVADGAVDPSRVARLLVAELTRGGLEREVAFDAQEQRFTVAAKPGDAEPQSLPLARGALVVVSGGARGVTAECLKAVASEQSLRFLLLGRTPLESEPSEVTGATDDAAIKRALLEAAQRRGEPMAPADVGRVARRILAGREVRATLEALRQAGSEAEYVAVNVTDPTAVKVAVSAAESRWGPVAAVVHAAGVIHDKRIVDKGDDQVNQVLDTKISGLLTLLEACQGRDLKAVLLFSSVAGFSGNVGQADYAMANAALDGIAAHLASRPAFGRVRSLAWGPWRGGMVSPHLEARFEAAGVPLIGLEEGAKWMVQELKSDGAVRVVLGGAPGSGPLLPGDTPVLERLEVRVSAETFPELADHAVDGPPVVPVVLVSDWMLGALSGLRPGASVLTLEDLRVRRGISLDAWPNGHLDLAISAQRSDDGSTELALFDEQGQVRYTARGRALAQMPQTVAPPAGLESSSRDQPYGGVLFHGPRFQALAPLEALGVSGAKGRLTDAQSLGWQPNHHNVDPARLDGALQLAVLVSESLLSGASLPTRFDRLSVDLSAQSPGLGDAWSVTREKTAHQATHDLVMHDGAGRVSAAIEGLETTRRPGWKPNP